MKHYTMLLAGLVVTSLIAFQCVASEQRPARSEQSIHAPRITNDDFVRSDRFLLGQPATDLRNGDIAFQWIDQGDTFFYRSQGAKEQRYLLVHSATGRKTPLFDHQAMATALSKALDTSVSASNLPIDRLFRLSKDLYRVDSNGKTLSCNIPARICGEEKVARDSTDLPAPIGHHVLFARDYNLWLRDSRNEQERPLTRDGVRGWSYGRPAESSTFEVTNRRAGRSPVVMALWSPDGRRFVSYRLDERYLRETALVQAIPEDGSFRPKLHSYHYALPGEREAEAAFFVYDVEQDRRTPIDYRALPGGYKVPLVLGHLWWSADGRKLYLLDAPLTRPFMKLMEVNPESGAVRLLVEESADTTYFPGSNRLVTPNVRALSNGDVIWFSERSGWGHLYRYDGASGRLKNAITTGEWLVRDILRVDEREGYVYLSGSGRERGEDIYNRHLYRVKLDGTGLQLLTPDPGDHDLPALVPSQLERVALMMGASTTSRISPNGAYIVDHFSTVQSPGHWLLRRKDGSLIGRLEDEDASLLPPFTLPEPFVVKSADGQFDLYGVISKPADFDPAEKYPVIDCIYPGPNIIKAPKTFAGGGWTNIGGGYLGGAILGDAQALADLGFVVVQVDGRGGPFRSKAFRDLSYRRMETAGMLEDHISAMRQLAKTRPWLDLERVGIFGSSGGGFATAHALIDYPDFFKVGVASAGNHEQRAHHRSWGETYHGPTDSTDYAKVFAGNDVSRFKGRLLLAHGEMDDNVHPANTMRLVDALIKGNKQFDMLIMPNVNHGIGGVPYFQRITQNYFLRNLLRAELPSDSDIVRPGAGQAGQQ